MKSETPDIRLENSQKDFLKICCIGFQIFYNNCDNSLNICIKCEFSSDISRYVKKPLTLHKIHCANYFLSFF